MQTMDLAVFAMADPDGGGGPPKTKEERGVALKERTRTRKPPMYKVLLHNDDYTTKEFVVLILESVFHRTEAEATNIMIHVHESGVGIAGIYSYGVAETKMAKTMSLAKRYEYPLQLSMEPE
jgi:ATP-dependent Clp protease adaptor protein ClpS